MPIYTYRCPEGHEWDEVRSIEGSETSQEPCATCVEAATGPRGLTAGLVVPQPGRKVPSPVSASFRGPGWTPKFYPNRKGK